MAQEFQEVVEVIVDQQTTSLSEPAFGIPSLVAEFDEADISGWDADQRAKYYALDTEMAADGFPEGHVLREALKAMVGQSPNRVEKVLVGRADSADATGAVTMNAIADEQPEFFDFHYKVSHEATIVFDANFIVDNEINMTVDAGGVLITIPEVLFDTDHGTTFDALVAAIQFELPTATIVESIPGRSIEISVPGVSIKGITAVVTQGAQVVVAISEDFVTDNIIKSSVKYGAGTAADVTVAVADVPFITDNDTTMAAWATAVEAAIATATATGAFNSLQVAIPEADRVSIVSYSVTGGATKPTIASQSLVSPTGSTTTVAGLSAADKTLFEQLGDWAISNERMFGYVTADTNASSSPYDSGAAPQPDLGSYFKSTNNERAYGIFDKGNNVSELDAAWAGENLPYGPQAGGPLNTWSFKQPKLVQAKSYTTSERSNLKSKSINVYTTMGGQSTTLYNYTATGEPIEAIINRDWTVFVIQRNVFTLLLNKRAVPLNDNGMLTVVGAISSAMEEATAKGAMVPGSVTITYPRFADLPEVDRNAGVFSGIVVEAKIQRATQKVNVRFVITA